MTSWVIHQILCGYDRGHRLLAHSSGARLDSVDAAERLSDLPGYVPTEVSADLIDYYRIDPLGPDVAFSRTWNDPNSSRRGTVVTHTLLIPTEAWVASPAPWSWARLHACPTPGSSRDGFKVPLSVEVEPFDWFDCGAGPLTTDELAELVELWQTGKRIVWLAEPTLAHVCSLWPMLGPRDRARFSFHGFMVGESRSRLALAPTMYCATTAGSPLDLAVRVRRGPAAELPDIAAIRSAAAALELDFMLEHVEIVARTIRSISRIRDGVSTASHIVLDSLGKLGTVGFDHPLVREMIEHFLASAAEPTPNPLWALRFALESPLVRAQLVRETSLAPMLRETMRELVERTRAASPMSADAMLADLRYRDRLGLALVWPVEDPR